jgi:hypothetical protein
MPLSRRQVAEQDERRRTLAELEPELVVDDAGREWRLRRLPAVERAPAPPAALVVPRRVRSTAIA